MSAFARLPRPAAPARRRAGARPPATGKEERAEAHYQRGVEFVAAGELDRAMIEFRNVFRLNASTRAARLDFARLLRDDGDPSRALSQYLLLVDQDRDNLAGQRELAALALGGAGLRDRDRRGQARLRARAGRSRGPRAQGDARLPRRQTAADKAAALEMARGVLAETPGQRARPHGADRRRDERRRRGRRARPGRRRARRDPRRRGAASRPAGRARAARATRRASAPRSRGWPSSSPTTPPSPRPSCSGACARATRPAPRRRCAPSLPATRSAPEPALTVARFLYETAGPAAARAELDRLVAAGAAPLPFQRARAGSTSPRAARPRPSPRCAR